MDIKEEIVAIIMSITNEKALGYLYNFIVAFAKKYNS